MSFKITWKTHVICFIISLLISFALTKPLDDLTLKLFIYRVIYYPTNNLYINYFIINALVLAVVSFVHELIHGLAYICFGGKVRYGFKFIYAYTHEVSGKPIPRTKFLIVLLLPLICISYLSLLIPGWIGTMVFILNMLGSSGDIYMAFTLCRYKPYTKIIDRIYGYDALNKPG